jgi:membrane-associated phospholipid phosphatase
VSPPAGSDSRPRWVLVAFAAAVLGVLGFTLVTLAIYGHGPLLDIDTRVEHLFARHRTPWLIHAFERETGTAAYVPAASFLLVASILAAALERAWRPFVLGVSAVVLLGISVGTGKEVIGRSRIPFRVNAFGDGGTSYPSGHTTTAVVVSGCLLLLFARWMSTAVRRWCLVGVAVYSLFTGFSRIYLRDHWFTDVLAGWFLGTAIVCVLALVFRRQPRSRA